MTSDWPASPPKRDSAYLRYLKQVSRYRLLQLEIPWTLFRFFVNPGEEIETELPALCRGAVAPVKLHACNFSSARGHFKRVTPATVTHSHSERDGWSTGISSIIAINARVSKEALGRCRERSLVMQPPTLFLRRRRIVQGGTGQRNQEHHKNADQYAIGCSSKVGMFHRDIVNRIVQMKRAANIVMWAALRLRRMLQQRLHSNGFSIRQAAC